MMRKARSGVLVPFADNEGPDTHRLIRAFVVRHRCLRHRGLLYVFDDVCTKQIRSSYDIAFGLKNDIWCATHETGSLCHLRTTQALIRADWSGPSLSAHRISGYCSICRRTENANIRLLRCTRWSGSTLSAQCIRILFVRYAPYQRGQKTWQLLGTNTMPCRRFVALSEYIFQTVQASNHIQIYYLSKISSLEPGHNISFTSACASSEDLVHPVRIRMLIRISTYVLLIAKDSNHLQILLSDFAGAKGRK